MTERVHNRGKRVFFSVDPASVDFAEAKISREMYAIATDAVSRTTRKAEQELESATRNAVGGKLWRAWKSRIYVDFPRAGEQSSRSGVTGFIYPQGGPRTEKAMHFLAGSGSFSARSAKIMWFPIRGSLAAQMGDRNVTPRSYERRWGRKLRPVFRRGKTPLLVDDIWRGVKQDRANRNDPNRRPKPVFAGIYLGNRQSRFSTSAIFDRMAGQLRREFRSAANRRGN